MARAAVNQQLRGGREPPKSSSEPYYLSTSVGSDSLSSSEAHSTCLHQRDESFSLEHLGAPFQRPMPPAKKTAFTTNGFPTSQRPGTAIRSSQTVAASSSSSSSSSNGLVFTSEHWTSLPEHFFTLPRMNQQEKRYLIRKACEAAQEVVERARSTGGPIHWNHLERLGNVQLYTGQTRGSFQSSSTRCMCGVTTIPSTIQEIASLFDLPTTAHLREFAAQVPEFYQDGMILHPLTRVSRATPMHQVTTKWLLVDFAKSQMSRRAKQPQKAGLLRTRFDFCVLECQDQFVDSFGRNGWVLGMHSIKLPGVQDLPQPWGIKRGSFYHSGLIVIESDRPNYVDVIHCVQMNLKQDPSQDDLAKKWLRGRVMVLTKISEMVQRKRLNEQRYLSDLEVVPRKFRSRCAVCTDLFTLLLLKKMNCRKCGEVVCGACSKEHTVTSMVRRKDGLLQKESCRVRICSRCFSYVTKVRPTFAGVNDYAPRPSSQMSINMDMMMPNLGMGMGMGMSMGICRGIPMTPNNQNPTGCFDSEMPASPYNAMVEDSSRGGRSLLEFIHDEEDFPMSAAELARRQLQQQRQKHLQEAKIYLNSLRGFKRSKPWDTSDQDSQDFERTMGWEPRMDHQYRPGMADGMASFHLTPSTMSDLEFEYDFATGSMASSDQWFDTDEAMMTEMSSQLAHSNNWKQQTMDFPSYLSQNQAEVMHSMPQLRIRNDSDLPDHSSVHSIDVNAEESQRWSPITAGPRVGNRAPSKDLINGQSGRQDPMRASELETPCKSHQPAFDGVHPQSRASISIPTVQATTALNKLSLKEETNIISNQ